MQARIPNARRSGDSSCQKAPSAAPRPAARAAGGAAGAGRRGQLQVARAADLDANLFIAGGAALIAAAGFASVLLNPGATEGAAPGAGGARERGAAVPKENAVLVFGGKGRTGRLIVQQLLRSGRTVVAAVRSADKARGVFFELDLKEGAEAAGAGSGALFIAGGVDVTDGATITPDLFDGVTQVAVALGSVAGRLPDGTFGYQDGASPKDVEGKGVANILKAVSLYLEPQKRVTTEVLPMRTAKDLSAWERTFRMSVKPSGDGEAVWTGSLEPDGASAARTRKLGLDLSAYDGLVLRARAGGQTFQLDARNEDAPDTVFAVMFDTPASGDWATINLPWHDFVPVKNGAAVNPDGQPFTGAGISELGLVLSQYSFNRMPNGNVNPGEFELVVDGGVSAYRDPRPQVVVLSSAGVERNAIVGDDADARKQEMPIVRTNPGDVLNWKYEAECGVRASRFPYTVVRATGLEGVDASAEPCLLEADQGDTISGQVSRAEAASVIVAALESPDAAGKTFELRRSEAVDARGKAMGPRQFTRMFLKLAPDASRWRVGLPPFPALAPAPSQAAAPANGAAKNGAAANGAAVNGGAKKAAAAPAEAEAPEAAAQEAPEAAAAEEEQKEEAREVVSASA